MAFKTRLDLPSRTAIYTGDSADDVITALYGPRNEIDHNIVFGNGGSDTITGNTTLDNLYGGKGDDTIHDTYGGDVLFGGKGDDTLTATGAGAGGQMSGGKGNDSLTLSFQGFPKAQVTLSTIDGGADQDSFTLKSGPATSSSLIVIDAAAGSFGYEDAAGKIVQLGTVQGIESFQFQAQLHTRFEGSNKDDTVYGAGEDKLFGGGGDDTLAGRSGEDLIKGGAGDDLLFGGDATKFAIGGSSIVDVLRGGAGDDVLVGSSGAAVLRGDNGDDVLIGLGSGGKSLGGKGNDAFLFRTPGDTTPFADGIITEDLGAALTVGDQVSRLPRDFGGLKIDGGKGVDWIYFDHLERPPFGSNDPGVIVDMSVSQGVLDKRGGGAFFSLTKIEGVVGTDHSDTIAGKRGTQMFEGGAGDDVLTGKGGADVFLFGKGSGADTITDFKANGRAADILDLTETGLRFNKLTIAADQQSGIDGTLVTITATDQIFLAGVAAADITKDDFEF